MRSWDRGEASNRFPLMLGPLDRSRMKKSEFVYERISLDSDFELITGMWNWTYLASLFSSLLPYFFFHSAPTGTQLSSDLEST